MLSASTLRIPLWPSEEVQAESLLHELSLHVLALGRRALALVLLLGGCQVAGYRFQAPITKVRDTRIGPAKMTADGIQSEVMSFCDTFTSSIAQRWNEAGSARSGSETGDPVAPDVPRNDLTRARRAAHERKLASVSAALSIASSPNPVVAVADMITLVTLERMLLEDPETEELFGPEATAKLLATYREHEAAIWRIGAQTFTAQQQQELRELIERWRSEHLDQRYVSQVRLEDFAVTRQQQMPTQTQGNTSLLSLVMLDPLAGMEPAKREVQESRMLAARAFFYLTRMPQILKWQGESFYQGLLRTPEVRDGVSSMAQVSEAVDRISKAVEKLPEEVAAERKTTLEQFFAGVSAQREAVLSELDQGQENLRGTLADFRETVKATDELAGSLTTTAQAIESVANRVMPDPGARNPAAASSGLAKYESAVVQTGATAERLTVLAEKLERLLEPTDGDPRTGALPAAVTQARESTESVIDYAFKRLLVLLIVAPLIVLLAIVSYRVLMHRTRALTFERRRAAQPLDG